MQLLKSKHRCEENLSKLLLLVDIACMGRFQVGQQLGIKYNPQWHERCNKKLGNKVNNTHSRGKIVMIQKVAIGAKLKQAQNSKLDDTSSITKEKK